MKVKFDCDVRIRSMPVVFSKVKFGFCVVFVLRKTSTSNWSWPGSRRADVGVGPVHVTSHECVAHSQRASRSSQSIGGAARATAERPWRGDREKLLRQFRRIVPRAMGPPCKNVCAH